MFSFLTKPKKGFIEKEFDWLSAERIVDDLSNSDPGAMPIVTSLCRFAIFGGIKFKQTLDKDKLLQKVDGDKVVVEAIGYTWSFLYGSMLKADRFDIYENEELADFIYEGKEVIRSILSQYVSFDIPTDFSGKYPNHNLIEATDKLTSNLLKVAGIGMLEGAKDQIGVNLRAKEYASQFLPMLVESSSQIVEAYCGSGEY